MKVLHINGNDLTLENVREVAYERRIVILESDARERVEKARAVVEQIVFADTPSYAITTGVGQLSDVRITPEQTRDLQINLLRSHCVGVGEPLTEPQTRAMMLLRANSLAKGYSGVRPVVIETLCEMLNRGVTPVVPSRGSVGASGDLAPLAHLALPLTGEGEVWVAPTKKPRRKDDPQLRRTPAAQALKKADIKPLQLEAKEAISLINGTQAMLALGILSLLEAENLADTADVLGALTLDALLGTDVAFDERIHRARPHNGQLQVAANLRRMLEGSEIRESHRGPECKKVQDAYSLRCIPQVHGALRGTLAHCREVFEIEANSAVDNPLVFPAQKVVGAHATDQPHGGDVLSGGNFHGEPVAFALDFLAIALTALAGISERRIDRLVNPYINEGLPPFLAGEAGLHSGLMMAQVTAAALVNENKVLASPASVDSIVTSGNKEDYVSMGMTAALKLQQVVANTANVLAIEAIAATQALDFRAPLKPGKRGQQAHATIRRTVPAIKHDRVFAPDIAAAAELVRSGAIAEALR